MLKFISVEHTNYPIINDLSTFENASNSLITTNNNLSIHPTTEIDWILILGIIYALGVTIGITRLLLQLFSLRKLIKNHTAFINSGYKVIDTVDNLTSASFFNYIFLDKTKFHGKESEMILTHEKIHARQLHSIDILLSKLLTSIQWFNPLAWWYSKIMEQNLEFIADRETIKLIDSSKEYQLALIEVSGNVIVPLTNNFNQSLIKKRIVMLNKLPSKNINKLKTAVILPFIAIFLWSFNIKKITNYQFGTVEDFKYKKYIILNTDSPSTLKELQKKAKEELDILIDFRTLEYNAENKISKIEVVYSAPNMEEASLVDIDTDTEIHDFAIVAEVESTKKIRKLYNIDMRYITFETGLLLKRSQDLYGLLHENTLFFLDDKLHKTKELSNKTIVIEDFTFINPEDAIAKYGEFAKAGILVANNILTYPSFEKAMEEVKYRKRKVNILLTFSGHGEPSIAIQHSPTSKN